MHLSKSCQFITVHGTNGLPHKQVLTLVGKIQQADEIEQCTFTGARRADDGTGVANPKFEVDIADYGNQSSIV